MEKHSFICTWRVCTGLVTALVLFGSAPTMAQDSDSANLIRDCIECHGSNGLGFKPGIPHLNGQADYLLTNMIESFQSGKRSTKVKTHRTIPAADVPALVKHYSTQKAERPKSATDPELVARGETIYGNRCADCHLDNGRESDKEAPLMAGQDMEYLIAQTLAFKTGQRKFPFLMDGAYKDLSEEDLTAAAHFFAAQEQVAPQRKSRRRRR